MSEFQETLFAPHGDWVPPKVFPNLSGVPRIGLDIESKDPDLLDKGPGFIRNSAEMVGISISTDDKSWYFPIRHFSGGNLNPISSLKFVRDLLSRKDLQVIGANLQYELEGLWSDDIDIAGALDDIQVAEAIISEEREEGYSLESLCKIYGLPGKNESLLKEAASAYAIDPKSGLWKLHSRYVGPYAEYDSACVLKIYDKQQAIIKAEELEKIYAIERELLPILWEMRKKGVRVDLDKAKDLARDLKSKEDVERGALFSVLGYHVDVLSGPDLAKMCEKLKIRFTKTPKGNASFTENYLEQSTNPVLQRVLKIRKLTNLRSTFVEKWMFNNQIKGVIHPQWKQMISDEGGTRTGRMAAANPNPQQVPARSELAPLIRACFIPEDGLLWGKYDYSQQEPRLLIHYASLCKLTAVDLIQMAYVNDPMMDIYQFLAQSCNMKRRDAKDATLGRMYNMGAEKFASKQSISVNEAKQKLGQFDASVPFVKELRDYVTNLAQRRGYIKTLLGRKRHFNYWEPADSYQRKQAGEYVKPMERAEAEKHWPSVRLQRAWCHKGLNSLIQGSAADMTKMAVIMAYRAGNIPYLVVHDEGDYGVRDMSHAGQIKEIYETCITLQVPVKCDMKVGGHWE